MRRTPAVFQELRSVDSRTMDRHADAAAGGGGFVMKRPNTPKEPVEDGSSEEDEAAKPLSRKEAKAEAKVRHFLHLTLKFPLIFLVFCVTKCIKFIS